MSQAAIDGTEFDRDQDRHSKPFTAWGETDATIYRICYCPGPNGLNPPAGCVRYVMLVEDPYPRFDRAIVVKGQRLYCPEGLAVPVADIEALAASRRSAYAEDEAWLKAQNEDELRRTGVYTAALPVNRARSTDDGLAIVAAALALAEWYVAAALRCRKAENRTTNALHALDALESARAAHALFELGTSAVVPAFATLAPRLWHAIADRYRDTVDAVGPPRDPSDEDIEALASLVD